MAQISNTTPIRDPAAHLEQLKQFIPAIIMYFFVTGVLQTQLSWFPLWAVVISKIIPILILLMFIVLQHNKSLQAMWENEFSKYIFLGLLFSLFGDTILVYATVSDIYFIAGMISFGIAHFIYVWAFGFKPFSIKLFLIFTAVATAVYWYLWQGGLNKETAPIKIGVAVYSFLNAGMNWRSLARLSLQDFLDGRWYEFFGWMGAISFLISDTALAINKFVNPFPLQNLVIMITYYVAQLGITLSIVDGPDLYGTKKSHKS